MCRKVEGEDCRDRDKSNCLLEMLAALLHFQDLLTEMVTYCYSCSHLCKFELTHLQYFSSIYYDV